MVMPRGERAGQDEFVARPDLLLELIPGKHVIGVVLEISEGQVMADRDELRGRDAPGEQGLPDDSAGMEGLRCFSLPDESGEKKGGAKARGDQGFKTRLELRADQLMDA